MDSVWSNVWREERSAREDTEIKVFFPGERPEDYDEPAPDVDAPAVVEDDEGEEIIKIAFPDGGVAR